MFKHPPAGGGKSRGPSGRGLKKIFSCAACHGYSAFLYIVQYSFIHVFNQLFIFSIDIEALSQGSGDFKCGPFRRQHKQKRDGFPKICYRYLISFNLLFRGLKKACTGEDLRLAVAPPLDIFWIRPWAGAASLDGKTRGAHIHV